MAARKDAPASPVAGVIGFVLAVVVFIGGGLVYTATVVPKQKAHKAFDMCMYEAGRYDSATATRCHYETGW